MRSWVAALKSGRHSIVERQLVMFASFCVALVLLVIAGVPLMHSSGVWISAGLLIAATAAAAFLPWRSLPQGLHLIVWFVDIIAVGFLRDGTGGPTSQVGALIILPVLSLSMERGRLPVILGSLTTVVIYAAPVLLNEMVPVTVGNMIRAIFTPLVLLITGLTVNEITSRTRARANAENALRVAKEQLLQQSEEYSAKLQAQADELRKSTELLNSVLDAATEQAIIGTDLDGSIQVFNTGAERMVGLSAQDLIGTHFAPPLREVRDESIPNLPPAWRGHDFASLIAALDGDRADVRSCVIELPDGSELSVQLAATTRRGVDNVCSGYMFVVTDMSELHVAAKMKDQFVSLISHELRTPLSSILGYIELISDDEEHPLSAEQTRYLGTVERNANRLLRLVGELLFTAQVEAGGFSLDKQPIGLAAIVEAAVESAQPVANSAGVDLVADLPAQPITMWGDAVRLGQACDNLVANAVKFTKPGGTVSISLHEDPTNPELPIRIDVSDTGIGIPASEIEKLSAPFFRATTATRNAVPGVGLGLTITKAIASAHGGSLRVTSIEGSGTTFSLLLPAGVPAAAE
ncbi:PAS domain S-box protein [Nakamurella silvestris]|nr:PAS domain S-box protein [Nakamurella silvestris]